MSDDELVTVYRAPNAALAGIIAAELEEEGIACRVSDENQGGFSGVSVIGVEIMVKKQDADRALAIIAADDKSHVDDEEEEAETA